MEATRKVGLGLVTLAALGLAAHPAAAQTGTFTDNFLNTGGANTSDINAGKGTPRQGGTVLITTPGGITYSEASESADPAQVDYDTQLDNKDLASAIGPNLLIASVNRQYTVDNYVSPNVSLAPGAGGTEVVSFGTIPNNDDWSGAFLGPQGSFVNTVGGIGFLLTKTGTIQVFENGVQKLNTTTPLAGFSNTTYNSVVETYVNSAAGRVFSLVIDGNPVFTDSNAFALTDYHVNLLTFGDGTGQSYFNNLSISSVAAAPEPSQTAALGLGVLGLAGLALTARRRSALPA